MIAYLDSEFSHARQNMAKQTRCQTAPSAPSNRGSSRRTGNSRDFFEKEYLPACYDQVGVWQMPDGAAAYAYFARQHTTTDLTPEQIHEIGLKEVARIRAEMEALKTRVSFAGTLPEFFHFLRTDPKFFYTNRDDLLRAYKVQAKTTDPAAAPAFQDVAAPALRRRTHPRSHRAGHVHGVLPARFGGGDGRGCFASTSTSPRPGPSGK